MSFQESSTTFDGLSARFDRSVFFHGVLSARGKNEGCGGKDAAATNGDFHH